MSMDVNHPSAVVLFGGELSIVAWQQTFIQKAGMMKRMGESGWREAPIIMMNRVEPYGANGKPVGWKKNFDIQDYAYGYTTPGDQNIRGDEKRRKRYQDEIQINQERYSYEDDGKFAESLARRNYREEVMDHLKNQYWPLWIHERVVAYLAGSLGSNTYRTIDTTKSTTSARDVKGSVASSGNDLRTPHTSRIIYGNARANQAALTTADAMSANVIDLAVEQAYVPSKNASTNRIVRPFYENQEAYYLLMADAQALKPMLQNVSERFYDVNIKAQVQGGMLKPTKIGALDGYVYRSSLGPLVKILPIQEGVKFSAAATGSVQAARSTLMGPDALRIFTSRASEELPDFSFHEETDNRGNTLVITTGMDIGFQRPAFRTTETGATRLDNGTVNIDTYAVWQ